MPDYIAAKPPNDKAKPGAAGMDALPGTAPFHHESGRDGLALTYRRAWWTARCRRTTSRSSRRCKIRSTSSRRARCSNTGRIRQPARKVGDPKFPYVITTYRLTEHYLAGAMSRWLPWLTELQPELFVEISPELAQEKGIKNLDWCRITSPRTQIRAKALVTRRMRPFNIDGKVMHQVGMPWHWGYEGLSTGDVVNELTSLVADPNVTIHEGKAFVCNVEKA